jgi:3-oxoacyl-[acyl-carrier protein] reductase
MHLGLDGKVIFIAGASRGIGLGIVRGLPGRGRQARHHGPRRGKPRGRARPPRRGLWRGPPVRHRRRHARHKVIEDAVARTEAEFGPIFGAVANVGLYPCPPGFEVDDETWDAGFTQNLDSAWRLSRARSAA